MVWLQNKHLFCIVSDEWEPVPLVTITEENEDALKNRLFKRALKKVGIVPPANEQVRCKLSSTFDACIVYSNTVRGNRNASNSSVCICGWVGGWPVKLLTKLLFLHLFWKLLE